MGYTYYFSADHIFFTLIDKKTNAILSYDDNKNFWKRLMEKNRSFDFGHSDKIGTWVKFGQEINISNYTEFQYCGILASNTGFADLDQLNQNVKQLPTFEEYKWVIVPGCVDVGQSNDENFFLQILQIMKMIIKHYE